MRTVSLGDLLRPVASWNPARRPTDEFDYVDLSAVDSRTKTITAAARTQGGEAPSRARQLIEAGDVLFATVRPNLNAVAVVPPHLQGATASTGFTVLRAGSELDNRYLFHWTRSAPFTSDMVKKATGASYPAVSDRIVKNSLIPVPGLHEQRRIAAILDQADALRAKRRQVLAHLDALTQSIFHEMFGADVADTALETVCKRITDGTHQPPQWTADGVPFLFVSNITTGHIDMRTQKHISEATWRELTKRTPIEVGDVLYSTVGSYGIPAVVKTSERFAFQRHIAHIKPDSTRVLADFLGVQLASTRLRRQAQRAARGIAQPTVNLADIRKFRVLVPPLPDQRRFISLVDRVDQRRSVVGATLEHMDRLFEAVQFRAFRGEL